MTVIAALGLDGVRAPLAFPGAVNATIFQGYVDQVLGPALQPGDVVVFDNLTLHLSPALFEAIERAWAGCYRCRFIARTTTRSRKCTRSS